MVYFAGFRVNMHIMLVNYNLRYTTGGVVKNKRNITFEYILYLYLVYETADVILKERKNKLTN